MKKFKLSVLLLLISVSAFAQTSRVTASYDLSTLRDSEDGSAMSLYGTSINYGKKFDLNKQENLFLELGLGATYGFYGVKEGYVSSTERVVYEKKVNYGSITSPINLVYRIPLSQKISLEPYAGISLKINVLASFSESYSDSYDSDENYDNSYNLLSDVETENNWSFGQLMGQVGVGVNFSKIYFGLAYSADLTELAQNTNYSTMSIKLGFNF